MAGMEAASKPRVALGPPGSPLESAWNFHLGNTDAHPLSPGSVGQAEPWRLSLGATDSVGNSSGFLCGHQNLSLQICPLGPSRSED